MGLKDLYVKANPETLREMLRQAESYMAAQLQSGIAADQRALSFVSLMAAATAVIFGGAVSLLTAIAPHKGLGWLCVAVAGGLLASMGIAILSARPCVFWYPGSLPKDWVSDVAVTSDLNTSLSEQLANYDDRIEQNSMVLNRNSALMAAALGLSWCVLLIGGGIGIYLLANF